MDIFTASEAAYKNGFNDGYRSGGSLATRIMIAYEQLSIVNTELSKNNTDRANAESLVDLQNLLSDIINLQVKLGIMKYE